MIQEKREKYLKEIFDFGIIIKGIDGILQVIGGLLLLFIRPEAINQLIVRLTQYELTSDPKDTIANYILKLGHVSASSEKFAVFFLLSHGFVKIFIVAALLKNKLWAYPIGIAVFTGFGIYQAYRYAHTHSLGLLILTIIDIVVIALTWHEYNQAKHAVKIKS